LTKSIILGIEVIHNDQSSDKSSVVYSGQYDEKKKERRYFGRRNLRL